MNHVITVDGVTKEYTLGERQPYKSLRETLTSIAGGLLRRRPATARETVRALDGVSLNVEAGEILGVIGRNGAGKTTLLKVLSRITYPTAGRVEIVGRVGSLLEVGTGFHPELTGRENVFLNGAILGMRRAEISQRFDEIVAFAEVDQFVDTPVKRYSSGMYLRLAFSVAAHLYPDILLVDEVLAVGDMEFQKKCLGKMNDVSRHGRTVLLVSHNLTAIKSLCSRVVWIDRGRLAGDGPAADVVDEYLQTTVNDQCEIQWENPESAPGCAKVKLRRAAVNSLDPTKDESMMTMTTPLELDIEYWTMSDGCKLNISLHVINAHGITVFNSASQHDPNWHGKAFPKGRFHSVCRIPDRLLNHGIYTVDLYVVEDEAVVLSTHKGLLSFEIHDAPELRSRWYGRWDGVIHPILDWVTERLDG